MSLKDHAADQTSPWKRFKSFDGDPKTNLWRESQAFSTSSDQRPCQKEKLCQIGQILKLNNGTLIKYQGKYKHKYRCQVEQILINVNLDKKEMPCGIAKDGSNHLMMIILMFSTMMFMMMIQKVVIGKDGKAYLEKAGFWRRGCAKRIIRNIAGTISLL